MIVSMFKGIFTMLKEKRYTLTVAILSVLVYASVTLGLNSSFVQFVAHSQSPYSLKLSLLLKLLTASFSTDQLGTLFLSLAVAMLFALNIALTVYVFNRQLARVRGTSSLGFIGLLSALLGLGCASCGPLLVTSILPILGFGGLLNYLPYNGKEFELLGIGILSLSVYFLSGEATKPAVC